MRRSEIQELRGSISNLSVRRKRVVLMPDFYLDHFLVYQASMEHFIKQVRSFEKQSGGIIYGSIHRQFISQGGNSVNAAAALSTLGPKCFLILRTSPLGRLILRHFVGTRVDLSHVKTNGKMGLTVAIEMEHKKRRFNILANDPGSIIDFASDSLTPDDKALLEVADCVCVFNWATNLCATDLMGYVFELVKKRGKGMTFFDPSDPSSRIGELDDFKNKVLLKRFIDTMSVNENEAVCYASRFDERIKKKRRTTRPYDLAVEAASILRDRLRAQVDLHTANYSATFGKEAIFLPTFSVTLRRATGAGDSWNAGDIYGYLTGLEDRQRLEFANAVAAYYISHPEGRHPTPEDVIAFTEKSKMKKLRKSDINWI